MKMHAMLMKKPHQALIYVNQRPKLTPFQRAKVTPLSRFI